MGRRSHFPSAVRQGGTHWTWPPASPRPYPIRAFHHQGPPRSFLASTCRRLTSDLQVHFQPLEPGPEPVPDSCTASTVTRPGLPITPRASGGPWPCFCSISVLGENCCFTSIEGGMNPRGGIQEFVQRIIPSSYLPDGTSHRKKKLGSPRLSIACGEYSSEKLLTVAWTQQPPRLDGNEQLLQQDLSRHSGV